VQLGVARSTIQDNLQRAQASGIAWPLPPELTDAVLEQRLFARPGMMTGLRRRSEPDWGMLARELGELLRAVAAFAAGGVKALEARKDASSVKLLSQMKKGGQS
jgi:hypothetical protein